MRSHSPWSLATREQRFAIQSFRHKSLHQPNLLRLLPARHQNHVLLWNGFEPLPLPIMRRFQQTIRRRPAHLFKVRRQHRGDLVGGEFARGSPLFVFPFQGDVVVAVPRALPWAGLFCTVGAEHKGAAFIHAHRVGAADLSSLI
jgi:hypothetical protein